MSAGPRLAEAVDGKCCSQACRPLVPNGSKRRVNVSAAIVHSAGAICSNSVLVSWLIEHLNVWSVDPSAHKNEIARTTFLKSHVFQATGKSQKASIALRVACRLRKEITQEDRDVNSFTMEDFDEIIAFWAR